MRRGVSVSAWIGGLLIVGGQYSMDSLGAQTFQNYYN